MKDNIVILGGPTGSGKSRVALSLCESFPLEIVNFDSMQVYRHMDIGTAKPTPEERERVPHHLYDIRDPDEPFSVGDFIKEGEEAIRKIREKGKVPLFVGGCGLYARSLIFGIDELPSSESVREELSARAAHEGIESLHGELSSVDPVYGEKVSPRDRHRVIRALEVFILTGEPYSSQIGIWERGFSRYDALYMVLLPDRGELFGKINDRVDSMMAKGFAGEVKSLLDRGYSRELRPMRAVGYKHVGDALCGEGGMDGAVMSMKRDTRRYAKRQITWFSREKGTIVVPPGPEKIGQHVESFLI